MSIATNKQALYDYQILETFEAGLVLVGAEVKSIKKGQINLKGSYINIASDSTGYLVGAYVAPYKPASSHQGHFDPYQNRQLILNKKEFRYLYGKAKENNLTVIPTKIYLKHNLIKLEIAIARGLKKYDKRELIKKRDFDKKKRSLQNSAY
jgi:SsrA-binding protein